MTAEKWKTAVGWRLIRRPTCRCTEAINPPPRLAGFTYCGQLVSTLWEVANLVNSNKEFACELRRRHTDDNNPITIIVKRDTGTSD